MKAAVEQPVMKALVQCPICSHTVRAEVKFVGKRPKVVEGQRCLRCSAMLSMAWVLQLEEVA